MSSLDISLDDLERVNQLWEFATQAEKDELALHFFLQYTKPTCDIFDKDASFVDWITSHFYIPEVVFTVGDIELKGPIWLADYQIQALNEATSKQDDLYKYSLIVWSDIKKSIKSTIAAAVALRMAFLKDWGSIKMVGNKKEQAKSRSYYYLTRALKLNPTTKKMLNDGDIKISNYNITFFFNNTTIQALPLNPEGEAGGNDDLIIWTEAWAARSKAAVTMNTEMVIPPAKFGKGFKWLESYAGYTNESPILEPLYKNNVDDKYSISSEFPFYANERTFVLWDTEPRLPWQSPEYYRQQSQELMDAEFRRIHKNEWVSSKNKFLEDAYIDAIVEKLPPLTKQEMGFVGCDASVSGDCFAMVTVTRHPTKKNKLAARLCRVWTPQNKKKLQYEHPNAKVNAGLPDGYITNICKKYNIKLVAYDPYQLHKMATDHNLQRKSAFWKEVTQGKPRLESDSMLRRLILDEELIIDSNLAALIQHLKNADAKINDEKIRLVKSSNDKKIDAAVALSMACYEAKRYLT